jgi:hypothetical protein
MFYCRKALISLPGEAAVMGVTDEEVEGLVFGHVCSVVGDHVLATWLRVGAWLPPGFFAR